MASAHVDTFVRDRLPPAAWQPEFRFDLPELLYPAQLNAATALLAGGAPDSIAVVNDTGCWTYAALDRLSDGIARMLTEEEGLVPGNRVLLIGPNCATGIAAWLGILKAGGVAVALMPLLRAGEIRTVIKAAAITHAIVDAAVLNEVAAARIGTTLGSLVAYDGDRTSELARRASAATPGFRAVATAADDPALIAFTSGSTGRPKGCIHFHRDVLAPADSFARHILQPRAGERWLCSAPLAFTFGLGMQLIFPLRFGGTAITLDRAGPSAFIEAIARHRANIVATAPTAYRAMLAIAPDYDVSSVRCCVSAGEHLPVTTWQQWREATGLAIIDGIGATELMHIFISASGDAIRPGTTGRAVPGYQATVLDPTGRPLDTGTGRLAIKGPTGCRYLADDRQRDYVTDGWNLTGDIFDKDAGGYFRYVARADGIIVSSGYNIAAPEVEEALALHPAVAECAVIGIPCPERGMRVKAFVVAAAGQMPGDALAAILQAHVKAVIAPYKYPREIAFLDALPRTSTGKLQRFALPRD